MYTALAENGYDADIIVDYLYKDWIVGEQYARLFPEFNQLGKPPYPHAPRRRLARTGCYRRPAAADKFEMHLTDARFEKIFNAKIDRSRFRAEDAEVQAGGVQHRAS